MKKITSFNINIDNLPQSTTSRQFIVNGDIGAEFILQVFNSSNQFYNFSSSSFVAGSNSETNLVVEMNSTTQRGTIVFPTNASGDTYNILLIAPSDKNTELILGGGKYSYSTTITQVSDTTLTFTPITSSSASYKTFPSSVESSASSVSSVNIPKNLNWDVVNTDSDGEGYGLRLIRQPIDTDWYFTTTETVDGAVSSGTEVIVDDLTDLATGMYITAVSSGSLDGTPIITAINASTRTLTISSAQTFADGITLTFQARGSSIIQKAIGASVDFSNFVSTTTSAVAAELTKTVRSDIVSTTVTLNGTYGVSGGNFVTISGVGVNNSATNKVVSVSASEAAGSMVMTLSQTLSGGTNGTKLYFTGSTQSINITNTFTISSHPSSNKTIYLNLDNFITPGVSGS